MMRGIGIALVVGALAASFLVGRVSAQEEGGGMDMEALQKAWADLGKPGPEHAEFKRMVGEWESHVKEMQPGAAAKESKGKSRITMVMNGLILREDYEGVAGGVPFKGVGFRAFNKGTGKFESVWMDSMSSGLAWMDGTVLEKGKAWEYKGHWFGPRGMKVLARAVIRHESDDKRSMEYYMDMGQGEMKSMEITYTRKK